MKVKELGLEEGHPEKNGVDVDLYSLVTVLKKKIADWEAKQKTGNNGTSTANGVEGVTSAVKEIVV